MFIKMMHAATGFSSATGAEPSKNYDLVECDSYRLINKHIPETENTSYYEYVSLEMYKHVNGENVVVFSGDLNATSYVLNNSGKTIDTIWKNTLPKPTVI